MESVCARFDDLSPGHASSHGFVDERGQIVAHRLDEVLPAFQAAEQAARDGMWVAGYVGYEAAPALNPELVVRPAGLHDPLRGLPLVRFSLFGKRIRSAAVTDPEYLAGDYHISAWSADATPDHYQEDLAGIGRAIMSGEIARLTHTIRLRAAFSGDPAGLYRDLAMSQRGSNAVCLDSGRYRIVSASPSPFFSRVGDWLEMRPVLAAGPRGRWTEEDRSLAQQLLRAGESSQANRLAMSQIESELRGLGEPASTKRSHRLFLERYETIWHLAAAIGTRLRPGTSLVEIFAALFPPVAVTGVPRLEAMHVIAATERSPRGVYCGAIGYLTPPDGDGPVDASFNVAVRTVIIDENEGVAEFGVGGAITRGSDVATAYEEARLKAKVLVERRPEFAIVEEVRCDEHGFVRLDEHIDRLADSAGYFGFECDRAAVRVAVERIAARTAPPAVIRIELQRSGTVATTVEPAVPWRDEPAGRSTDLVLAARPVSSENVYLYHQTTNRRFMDSAQRQGEAGDGVILWNERDEVIGVADSVFLVDLDGKWLVPPVDSGCQPRVLRDALVAAGSAVEQVLPVAALHQAQRLALVDEASGWRGARLLR
jgi:para-aminobenzoate synthetase/4-amino-4-deoxychorismate lyase